MAKTLSKKGSASRKPVAVKAAASAAKSTPKGSAKPAARKAVAAVKAVAKAVAPVAKTAAKAVAAAKPAAGAKAAAPAKSVAAVKAAPHPKAAPAKAVAPPAAPTKLVPPAKPAAAAAAAPMVIAAKSSKRVEPFRPAAGQGEGAYVPPPKPTPVPTDGKPRKNQAGLTAKELESFRDLLLAKRREITGDMNSMESEALRGSGGSNLSNLPMHMADMGTDNYEQEFTLGLMEKDRKLLREINAALAKIQDGSYGICEGTGLPISKARLEAQPWAKYSIEHARKMEKGMIR